MTTTNLPSRLENSSSRARRIAEAHFTSEVSNDADIIMRTMVSGDLITTAVVEGPPESRLLVSCKTPAEQRDHYGVVRSRILVRGADLFTSVGADWYGFVHGIVHVELIATGEIRANEMIGVMPVSDAEDAILGEIGLAFPHDAKQGDAPGEPALERAANLKIHHNWLTALRAGDTAQLTNSYSDDASVAARLPGDPRLHPLRGREAVRAHYDELFSTYSIESIDVMRRIVDRWYVFAELAWVLRTAEGQPVQYQSANAIVVGVDDRIIVDLGYGTDLTPA